MIVQLFRACTNSSEVVYDKWMMPLDLLSLATSLKNTIPEIEVEIIDGQVIDKPSLLSKINPSASLVGITYTVFSVDCMEEIAKIAKNNGSFVVLGGHAATASAENLLLNSDIDAVIKYDGEIPLSLLVKKLSESDDIKDLSDIPNTLFRASSSIGCGRAASFDINDAPIPLRQFAGVNIEEYIKAYNITCTEKMLKASRPTNAYSKRGCTRSCSFCGRIDKTFRARSPEIVYKEYSELSSKNNIDYIYDHSDTWIDKEWMNGFMNLYEEYGPLDIKYMIFGDVRDIKNGVVKQLRELGVDIILLGLESGSEDLLKRNGKKLTVEDMKSCISMLADENIRVSASFVLGMMGETDKSLDETISFISEIKALGEVTIYCNLIIPLPGSWQWKLMMENPYLGKLYHHKYNFNLEELRELYVDRFTSISGGLRYLRETRDMILKENGMPILEYAR